MTNIKPMNGVSPNKLKHDSKNGKSVGKHLSKAKIKEEYHNIKKTFARNYFRSLDLFARPVTLTFKGHSNYKTNCGACLSILYFLMIAFFITKELLKVQNGYSSSVNY